MVVQSPISANCGLNSTIVLVYVYPTSIYFKTLENLTSDDPDEISENKLLELCFEFHVNLGLSYQASNRKFNYRISYML